MFGSEMMMAAGGGLNVDDVFATTLSPDGVPAGTVLPLSFAPDLDWRKNRIAGNPHVLMDSLRGRFGLATSSTAAQYDAGTDLYHPTGLRNSTVKYAVGWSEVIWSFRRAERFFDIVRYTGNGQVRQLAHGLKIKPGLIIVKWLNGSDNWPVYHRAYTASQVSYLNLTNEFGPSAIRWNNTEPTDTQFTLSTDTSVNANNQQYVAYLFADDPDPDGIIRCGMHSATGNGAEYFVDIKWEPQFLLNKVANAASEWRMVDIARGFGVGPGALSSFLHANDNSAEVANGLFFSRGPTGFYTRGNSGWSSIFMAIRRGAL